MSENMVVAECAKYGETVQHCINCNGTIQCSGNKKNLRWVHMTHSSDMSCDKPEPKES